MRRPAKTAGIALSAALLAVLALLVVALLGVRGGTRNTIVLPDADAPAEPELAPAPAEALFVAIDRGNIQAALDGMRRPEACHQTLSLVSYWENGSAETTVELWYSGNLARAQVQESRRTRHLLTDGQTLWLWYEGGEAVALTPDASVGFDDLIGIPTYEALSSIPEAEILDAGFVTLDAGVSCLYIAAQDGEIEERYWVDTATQLLYRADAFQGAEQTYQLRQRGCEVLSAADAAMAGVFRLPDGTELSPSGA